MQPTEEYLVWDIDPVIFTITEFQLPIPIYVWGLILGGVLLYLAWPKVFPPEDKTEVPGWKPPAVILLGLIAGQLPFLLIGGPSIDTLGPISPRYYGLMFASAFIFGYLLNARLMKEGGRSQVEVDRLLIYMLIATIIGARLGHVIFYELDFYLRNPQLIPAIWMGGLASHGAAIGILIAMWLFAKKSTQMSFLWLADRVVPAVAVGGMFIRIGNFFNSEILGTPTDLPWAVIFANYDMAPRHPSMLYESLFAVLVLVAVLSIYYRYNKKPPEGAMFGTFLILLFTGRFLIEFTKLYHADFEAALVLNMGQWLSIPLILFGIWLLVRKVNWKK